MPQNRSPYIASRSPPRTHRRHATRTTHPLGVPQIHINGALDPIVPVDYVQQYILKAEKAGDDVRLEIVPDAAHFEIVVPTTAAWGTVKNALLELL